MPVTVIEVSPNRVSQVKTDETDGYNAVQLTVSERRLSRVSKPVQGHVNKWRASRTWFLGASC